jgi:Uncharacterized protein conserved in bacteria
LEIKRQKEIVEAFHYDMRRKDSEDKTEIRIGFSPLKVEDENYPKENSVLGARLEFRLVFEEYILAGRVSQINHVINRQIENQEDINQDEIDELVAPLFKIVERMAYEVTEIALDKPGVKLNFQQQQTEEQTEE